jgi:hypothetical protein
LAKLPISPPVVYWCVFTGSRALLRRTKAEVEEKEEEKKNEKKEEEEGYRS